jgi:hypothetical protein
VACRLVADCGPSVYDEVVALVEASKCPNYLDSLPSSSIDSGHSELPLEEEAGDVSIHREVETAITHLEPQPATEVTLEREPCITQGRTIQGWTAMPGGVVEPSTPLVPARNQQLPTTTSTRPTRGYCARCGGRSGGTSCSSQKSWRLAAS